MSDNFANDNNVVEPKHRETPPFQKHVLTVPDIVILTALIYGVYSGNTTLIYVAISLLAAYSGQPVVKNLLLLIREKFLSDSPKKH